MLNFREPSDLAISFEDLKLVDHRKSSLQDIAIYAHSELGKILVIDDEVQHVEAWAPIYHEMLVHLPVAFLPQIEKVLILGGGSLFAAAEALKYETVKKVVLIDHDMSVIEIVRRNYRHANTVLADRRFDLRINDAFKEVKENNETFDLIVNDSIDLVREGRGFSSRLLNVLANRLKPDGICSDVVYRSIFERKTTRKTLNFLRKDFHSTFSLVAVPEYPGIFHVLCLWSKTNGRISAAKVVNPVQKKWIKSRKIPCEYYDPRFLAFYSYLPKYLWRMIGDPAL